MTFYTALAIVGAIIFHAGLTTTEDRDVGCAAFLVGILMVVVGLIGAWS